jgi:hypothetical protein
MHSSDVAAARLQPMPVPFQSLFPRTRYFEIDSQKAGARYAVWVTTPEAYDKSPDQAFAAIYMPDGNWNVATAAGLCDLDQWDFIDLFQPTIQISVGYIGKDAALALAVRARDLLPPLPDADRRRRAIWSFMGRTVRRLCRPATPDHLQEHRRFQPRDPIPNLSALQNVRRCGGSR